LLIFIFNDLLILPDIYFFMADENKNNQEENFSSDPEKNLQIENEILKLKMQAERGAFFGGNMEDLSPEMEVEFLKNVQQFEDSFDNAKSITIYECIGSPAYKKPGELQPEEVETELRRIMELLHSKNILLDVLGRYELSVIYKFITEELFLEQIKEVDHPGYLHSYIYEEFHPNHNVDIGKTAQEFLNHWFEKSFDENSIELANPLITPEGKMFSRGEGIQKLAHCLNSYRSFSNIQFAGSDTSYEWDDETSRGIGHAEGMFKYDALLENGDTIHIEGPFKLYMSNDDGCWRIFYFVFPGFAW